MRKKINLKKISKLSLISKLSIIHSIVLGTLFFLRKNTLGYDEREYFLAALFKDNYQVNSMVQNHEFFSAPLFIIRFFKFIIYQFKDLKPFEMDNYIQDESLVIFKAMLFVLLLLIPFIIYKITAKFQRINSYENFENSILSITLIISIPIVYGKNLFSLISLLSIPIILWIYYCLIPQYDKEKNKIYKITNKKLFIAGALLSIVSFFRFDSIIIYLFIAIQYFLFIIFNDKNKRSIFIKFMSISLGYLLFFIPNVMIYAFNSDITQPPEMMFTDPYGGSGWIDGPFKYIEKCHFEGNNDYVSMIQCIFTREKLTPIIYSFAANVKELSKVIFSIDNFPIYLAFLPCSGFLLMFKEKQLKELFIFNNALIFSSFAYTIFAIEVRYMLFTSIGLALYSIYLINNINKINSKNLIRLLLLILFITSYFYLLFGNSTYSMKSL